MPVYFHVNSFTNVPYRGNPAEVVILTEDRPTAWMQQTAAEMGFSETAFVRQTQDGYSLRWFTPKVEVDLCGHATLATAHVLFQEGLLGKQDVAYFQTLSGQLTAAWQDGWIHLDFPVYNPQPAEPPQAMLTAVGVKPTACVQEPGGRWLWEVATEQEVRNAKPDFQALGLQPGRGLILTAKTVQGDFDFISRYFAPWVGINEDPVTGSAHCLLAPYWAVKLSRLSFKAFQASTRGGELKVNLDGKRVHIFGQAVTIVKGSLLV
ncbi:MAG TPA: PhzF family phenazine biosynthesis protein [Longilinea sp.]|nr:PhzF family phenazine biosynthesis protein [Longilinea sp.]